MIWFIYIISRPLASFVSKYFDEKETLSHSELLHFAATSSSSLSYEKKTILTGLLYLDNTPVHDVMIPTAFIPRISISDLAGGGEISPGSKITEGLSLIVDDDDKEIGVTRDDLCLKPMSVEMLYTTFADTLFLPLTITVGDAISQFLNSSNLIAIVNDENGTAAGVLTVDLLFETLLASFGKAHDDLLPDSERLQPTRLPERITLSGQTDLRSLDKMLGVKIPRSRHYRTLGGLIIEMTGAFPKEGDSIVVEGLRCTVITVDRHAVGLVLIEKILQNT